jgi:DNA-directed RNA polymerase subunit RPC12/RpoP
VRKKENPRTARTRAWRRQGIDLTWDSYLAMLKKCDGKCEICGKKPRKVSLSVDHNHKTGEIRGLLCTYCNSRVLKYMRDDAKLARGLVRYLKTYFFQETH